MRAPTVPGGLPLLGHAWALFRCPMSFLRSVHPLGDVVRIRLGTLPVHVVNTPELVHEILVTQGKNFRRGRFFEKVGVVAGQDLTRDGPEATHWQRRMLQPAFHRDRIRRYARIIGELANARAESWQAGQVVDLHNEMFDLVTATMAKTMFAAEAGDEAATELRQAMPTVLKQVAWQTLLPLPLLEKLPTPANRRFQAATRQLRDAIDKLIDGYRGAGQDHGDLLSVILASRDDTGRPLSDAQVYSSIVFLMIAGTHTTALTLSSLFDELGRHPEIETLVRHEIDTTLSGRPASVEDLPKLEYTGRVVNETLRLHTPVRLLMRRTIVSTTLGGVGLPPGAEVLYSPYALHRDARWFTEPLRFDPDRWLPERRQQLPRGAFAPFSIGRDRCLGESLAWVETILTAVCVASRWRLEPRAAGTIRESESAIPRPPVLPVVIRPA